MNHDIIVIGASAGGVEVLLKLVEGLPKDLPASVFVVVHTLAGHKSLLPELLNNRGPLPATHPLHGDPIRPGNIYIASPDNHLYVRRATMDIVRGPKENGHRPSVDALFRSASVAHGPRVIGVVLSGYLDCGTAEMMSVKAHGGISVVQEPSSATAAEMPRSVIASVPVDHVVEPDALANLLATLARTPMAAGTDATGIGDVEGGALRTPSDLVCPLCQGTLTEAHAGAFEHSDATWGTRSRSKAWSPSKAKAWSGRCGRRCAPWKRAPL
jgi:two-component system, chemotaxis family, protein-glutamate methylesterase/glutaminase